MFLFNLKLLFDIKLQLSIFGEIGEFLSIFEVIDEIIGYFFNVFFIFMKVIEGVIQGELSKILLIDLLSRVGVDECVLSMFDRFNGMLWSGVE